jgi:glycerol dehydrogenase-like iron-containing ADH family enzyme
MRLQVGLPTCFADLGVTITPEKLAVVARKTLAPGSTVHNCRGGLTVDDIIGCMVKADALCEMGNLASF